MVALPFAIEFQTYKSRVRLTNPAMVHFYILGKTYKPLLKYLFKLFNDAFKCQYDIEFISHLLSKQE
ncbi:hypothetical protein EB796_022201 [Bugula neritina]|uniref:Uncharacterized protein n=1 Tax=Bugula neritina TaxID=10212 RepID=A0A7J7J186_BUGNE|nr:hypothetical protein EB796_022201 [Bugula neritina]